jgi:hypothetical protein
MSGAAFAELYQFKGDTLWIALVVGLIGLMADVKEEVFIHEEKKYRSVRHRN